MAKCAFLGLGVMGYPMAGHLVGAGHDVTVWNRTIGKAKNWSEEYNGHYENDIQKTVQAADFVMICVGEDADVYAVVKPAIEAMSANAIIVDHTTASAECARKCHDMAKVKSIGFIDAPISGGEDADVYAVVEPAIEAISANAIIVDHTTASAECARKCHDMAKAKSIGFIDAPISGGEAGAVNGQLTIMCGGDEMAFQKANPIMNAYAKATKLMGDSGAGQLTKMVNQICIAGILQGLAEGVHFAQKAGLDVCLLYTSPSPRDRG